MPSLLAVDLGLRTGLALYGGTGRLAWYRSQNYGKPSRLKRAVPNLLRETDDLRWLVIEGGGRLIEPWRRAAERRDLEVLEIGAEAWRHKLLYQREQRSGAEAKQHADEVARRVIEWSGAPRPTSLRHDAAEAILIGLWGAVEVGLLEALPLSVARPTGKGGK